MKTTDHMTSDIIISDCEPRYFDAFRALNAAWISKYFTMEASDYKVLDNPQQYILDNGGHILVALRDGIVLGVCALLRTPDKEYDYELAKMAVTPEAQGLKIGYKLGVACIERAKEMGAVSIYLESNTALVPAISLYRKLGFEEVTGFPTPYARCNIKMLLRLP